VYNTAYVIHLSILVLFLVSSIGRHKWWNSRYRSSSSDRYKYTSEAESNEEATSKGVEAVGNDRDLAKLLLLGRIKCELSLIPMPHMLKKNV
jgi:hypothetical protein